MHVSITRLLQMGVHRSSVYADALQLLATIARPNQLEARPLPVFHWNGRKECGAKVPGDENT
jgi:hypothetical protein